MANNNHFELTLDTLAPTGSISGLGEFEKENKTLVIDGGNATFKKVWFDTLSAKDVTKECDGYKNAEWEAKDAAVESLFTTTGKYYYHLVLMDDVNNESEIYTLGPVNYDKDIPVVSNVVLKDSRNNSSNTNETTVTLSFDYTDVGTGVYKAVVSGDIEQKEIQLVASSNHYEGQITFKADAEAGKIVDGNKKVSVVVYDRAENISASVDSNVILLDRELNKPTLLIQNSEGLNLPEYINYRAYVAKLSTTEDNIVAYKIWEGDVEPEAWVELSEMGKLDVSVERTFSDGDGLKSVKAKVKDVAGNTMPSDVKTTTIDSVPPVSELMTDRVIISRVAGFDKAILTFGNTADNEGGSGINYFELRRGEDLVISGAELPASHEVTVGALSDGTYKYTLMVEDKAKNRTTSSEVSIKVDTTAPTLTITQLNTWYTNEFDVNVSYSDASNLATMVAWSSTVAEDTTKPQSAIEITPTTTIGKGNINWTLSESADNYMHVMLVDEVGNVSYAHSKFGYDTVAPVIKTASFTAEAYPSTAATIKLTYEDATSGVVEMRVSGDITDGTAEGQWEPIVGTRNVALSTGDGKKTVLVEIRDTAGLSSSKSINCELDTTFPSPVLDLFEADNINPKPAHSALASFSARLKIENDDFMGGVKYKLYGDFCYNEQGPAGVLKDDAEWKDFVLDTGKEYMSITNLFCTSGDGPKNIYVVVKDNAGNEMTIKDPKSFVYDTTLPIVTVSDIDYNRISKIHVERRNNSGLIVGKFADEIHFTFKPDSVIQAYKVCAYADASAAAAGSASDNAIGMNHGSIGMSASGLGSDAAVSAKITGADYEAALGGAGHDGAHIVVVYVQDLAGQWSVAAQF